MTTAVLVCRSMCEGSRELIKPTDLNRGNRIAVFMQECLCRPRDSQQKRTIGDGFDIVRDLAFKG
jgi:hypothetical protein